MRHKTASCCFATQGLKLWKDPLPLQASAEREETLSTYNLWLSILHISTVNIDINIDTYILCNALQILLKSVEHSHDLSWRRFINSASDLSNLCFLRHQIPVIAGIWKARRQGEWHQSVNSNSPEGRSINKLSKCSDRFNEDCWLLSFTGKGGEEIGHTQGVSTKKQHVKLDSEILVGLGALNVISFVYGKCNKSRFTALCCVVRFSFWTFS